MKNNYSFKSKRIFLTNFGAKFLLLCILLIPCCTKVSATDTFVQLQTTYLTLDLPDISLEEFFKILEKESDYVFFYKEDVIEKNERLTVKARNESVVSILNRLLPAKQLTYKVKGRQVIIIRMPQKADLDVSSAKPLVEDLIVRGVVVDSNGQPLPGVNIQVQGRTIGAITDLSGSFTLQIKEAKRALLIASYVGFETQKVWVSTTNFQVKITLVESTSSLNEIVVVGYGTQKKINLTGAVTTASGDILENRPIGNIAQGVQGIIPNLNITFNSGQPNTTAKINIRGNTSLNGGNALILVDGVEISDLSMLNPQDVESISVLKDASAAAIYGARAAFGVMLVNTKKGARNQKTRINYSNNFSWSSPARLPEMPRSDVWARTWNKAFDYDNPGTYYFNDKFLAAVDAHIADPVNNPAVLVDTEGIQSPQYTPGNPGWAYVGNTDWLREFYKKAAFMQQHNLGISGGTERNNYYVSIGYKDQSGIFRYGNDSYRRFNLAFNFDTKLTDWLDMSFTTRMNHTKNNEPYLYRKDSAETLYYEVYRMYPTLPVFLPNGDFAGLFLSKGNFNIIGKMALAGRNVREVWDQWYTGKFDLHPFKGLSVKGDYSYNRYAAKQKKHGKEMSQTFPEGVHPKLVESPSRVENYNSGDVYQALNLWGEYRHSLCDTHNFTFMLGYNQEEKKISSTSYIMTDLYDNNLPVSDMAINYLSNDEVDDVWRVQGVFYRLNYDYKSKYLLEVNGRYDGSSKYAKDNRWAFFPSASLGWRVSEEKFFIPLKSLVDNLKLRFSIGALGNQVTSGLHSYMSTLKATAIKNYVFNGKVVNGLSAPSLPSLVTWEKVITKNVGLDWALFKNRLNGTFDFYIRDTKNMVRSVTLPAVLGTTGGKENIADMRTKGWELELSWRDRSGKVLGSSIEYSLGLGLSDYQAEITKYDNPNGSLASGMYYKGQMLGEIWGYVTDGFIQDEREASKMNFIQKYISSKWFPGDIRYKDLNEDGVINQGDRTLSNPGDQKVIGNSTPRYRFNLQAGIGWQGFNLHLLFEGVCKRDLWTGSDIFWGFSRGIYNSVVTQYHIDNTWTKENPTAYYPRLSQQNIKSHQIQTKFLQNAAYIRLKNISLSYSFPKSWLSKLKLEQVRVYLSGMNLWEKTGLPPFMTPDIVDQISDSTLNAVNAGKEYAFMRSYSLGINVIF